MYYSINESTARAAHEMMSMRDYKPNEATADYRAQVDSAAALVERKKQTVSPFYHEKLDHLLDKYARVLADAINRENEIGTRCPSILISGGSNFPVRKKEKQVAAWDANRKNFEHAKAILHKIKSIGTGAIDFADPNASELLQDRVDRLQKELDDCKAANAFYRKHKTLDACPGITERDTEWLNRENVFNCGGRGTPLEMYGCPFPPYHLTSIRNKLKAAQKRLEEYDQRQQVAQEDDSDSGTAFDGGEIVRNVEIDRLQIIFDDIPDADTRAALKAHGFRWSPKNKAWQRQLTENAERAAKTALGI